VANGKKKIFLHPTLDTCPLPLKIEMTPVPTRTRAGAKPKKMNRGIAQGSWASKLCCIPALNREE
jgi:hypothetical protein